MTSEVCNHAAHAIGYKDCPQCNAPKKLIAHPYPGDVRSLPKWDARYVPTWLDYPGQHMPDRDHWHTLVNNGWEDLRIRLLTRPPKRTVYTLYAIDDEGDSVCRHCGASYNFGHFDGCLYYADWMTDRRTLDLQSEIRKLKEQIKSMGAPNAQQQQQ